MNKIGPYLAGPEFRVSQITNGNLYRSDVAQVDQRLLACWSGLANKQVFGRFFDEVGNPISNAFPISMYPNGTRGRRISIAPLASGLVIVWGSNQQDGSNVGVYGRLYDNESLPLGSEFRVNTQTEGAQGGAQALALPEGFVAVYASSPFDGSGYGVVSQLFHPNGTRIGDEFQVNTHAMSDQTPGGIARVSSGFIPVWTSNEQDGSAHGVYGRLYSFTGQAMGKEFLANNQTLGSQVHPDIAAWPEQFVIVWESRNLNGSSEGIFGQLFHRSLAKIGPEFPIHSQIGGTHKAPRAAAPKGRFVVVWQTEEEQRTRVYGRLFTDLAKPVTEPFLVGLGQVPAVTTTSDGFAVIWHQHQDGDDWEVLGRTYTAIQTTMTATVWLETSPPAGTTSWLSPTTTLLQVTTSLGITQLSATFAAPAGFGSTSIALVAVIVGLVLSLCASLGLHLYHRRKRTTHREKPDELHPIYSEAPDDSSHQYVNLPISSPSGHYQDPPVPRKSTPDDYDSFRVVEEENPKY